MRDPLRLTDEQRAELERNLRLAWKFVARARKRVSSLRRFPLEDCQQAAMIALAVAIVRYTPSKGKLSTFANWHMMGAMQEMLRYEGMVTAPRELWTPGKIRLEETREKGLAATRRAVDAAALHSKLLTEDDAHVADKDAVEYAMAGLTGRQRRIVRMRFVQGQTANEIATRLGCSSKRVHQILDSALRLMRVRLEVAR